METLIASLYRNLTIHQHGKEPVKELASVRSLSAEPTLNFRVRSIQLLSMLPNLKDLDTAISQLVIFLLVAPIYNAFRSSS